jgi:hypothetical protein
LLDGKEGVEVLGARVGGSEDGCWDWEEGWCFWRELVYFGCCALFSIDNFLIYYII